jgi:hypothetical protein
MSVALRAATSTRRPGINAAINVRISDDLVMRFAGAQSYPMTFAKLVPAVSLLQPGRLEGKVTSEDELVRAEQDS